MIMNTSEFMSAFFPSPRMHKHMSEMLDRIDALVGISKGHLRFNYPRHRYPRPYIWNGYEVRVVGEGWVQVRFPRSKKRRIRKKWAKRNARNLSLYFEWQSALPQNEVIQMDGCLYMTRSMLDALKESLQRSSRDA